jgi:hypothetical protein
VGGQERIRAASDETLLAIAGIGPRHVRALRAHFGAPQVVGEGMPHAVEDESGDAVSLGGSLVEELPATED